MLKSITKIRRKPMDQTIICNICTKEVEKGYCDSDYAVCDSCYSERDVCQIAAEDEHLVCDNNQRYRDWHSDQMESTWQ